MPRAALEIERSNPDANRGSWSLDDSDPTKDFRICTHWKRAGTTSYLNIVREIKCRCGKIMKLNITTMFGQSLELRWVDWN